MASSPQPPSRSVAHWLALGLVALLLVAPLVVVAADAAAAAEECASSSSWNNAPTPPLIGVPDNMWLPRSVLATEDYQDASRWKAVQVAAALPSSSDDAADAVLPLTKVTIGHLPQFSTATTLEVLQQARDVGWQGGSGEWPRMSLAARCTAIEHFLTLLEASQQALATALMWEIGKSWPDALAEVQRTIQFSRAVLEVVRTDPDIASPGTLAAGSHRAWMRRAALGIILCLGPYNYPLNETYATLIPALLMGNICILKIPTIGGLVHLLTMKAFDEALPPGTIHFVSGAGRATMPPLMESGQIDALAFIGGSAAADTLIAAHPHPHRLKVFLQLEANNMAVYLPDLFTTDNEALLKNALEQAVIGSLSYNGQRCTALKLHFCPSAHGADFAQRLADRVDQLFVGLPWQQHEGEGGTTGYSKVTPLPTDQRIAYMQELLADATAKGATILNPGGGQVLGGPESTLMRPAVVYPVTPDMRLYYEEQFGPIVPVTTYDDLETILAFGREGIYGQQVSIFGHDASLTAQLVDPFSSVFGKINLNRQCGRSPDEWPFSGRRSSAMGVMSVKHALLEFSTPTLVAYGADDEGSSFVAELAAKSSFLQPVA
jgi:glyceraldehyde-3-phosphate dehydrogenase (NADP+)